MLEVFKKEEIIDLLNDGFKFDTNAQPGSTLFLSLLMLLNQKISIKNRAEGERSPEILNKKINAQLTDTLKSIAEPKDYLSYSSDGSDSINNSPGYNSEKYLEIILNNQNIKYVFIDQPEDNLGNSFISDKLVKIIRQEKFGKQMFLVTHNPSIVVYGDAENVIISENESNTINYRQVVLEDEQSQKDICRFLDGGEYIFDMRSKKYNIQKLLKEN